MFFIITYMHCVYTGNMKSFPKGFYSCLSGFVEVRCSYYYTCACICMYLSLCYALECYAHSMTAFLSLICMQLWYTQPCESVQEAAVREIYEESGIAVSVSDVYLIDSQPWPLSRSGSCELMIGCVAIAKSWEICIHDSDVASVRWFTRAEVATLISRHDTTAKTNLPTTSIPTSTTTNATTKADTDSDTDTPKPTTTAAAAEEEEEEEEDLSDVFIPGAYAIAHHLLRRFALGEYEHYYRLHQAKLGVESGSGSKVQVLNIGGFDSGIEKTTVDNTSVVHSKTADVNSINSTHSNAAYSGSDSGSTYWTYAALILSTGVAIVSTSLLYHRRSI